MNTQKEKEFKVGVSITTRSDECGILAKLIIIF